MVQSSKVTANVYYSNENQNSKKIEYLANFQLFLFPWKVGNFEERQLGSFESRVNNVIHIHDKPLETVFGC